MNLFFMILGLILLCVLYVLINIELLERRAKMNPITIDIQKIIILRQIIIQPNTNNKIFNILTSKL